MIYWRSVAELTTWVGLVIAVAFISVGAVSVWAVGFYNPDQGSAATAQGQAFTAQADDPSAIFYNPAGLTQLDGTHTSAGSYVLRLESKYEGSAGTERMEQYNVTPH